MNNWRLLLLAVVAVLHPIGSLTESNFIDGRERCEHRSNLDTTDTKLYGNRKSTLEERRLSTREDFREEKRHAPRNDPIIRSRERLNLERAERRIFSERRVRFSGETKFARELERNQRTSADDTATSRTRDLQNQRTSGTTIGDSSSLHKRNVLDSRRIRMLRVDTGVEGNGNERLYRDSLDSRDSGRVRYYQDLHGNSPNRVILQRERENVARDQARRDSTLRSVDMSQRDNNRESRSERRVGDNAKENRRIRFQDSRVHSVYERQEIRSRVDSQNYRGSVLRAVSERVDERKKRGQYKVTRDITKAMRSVRILSAGVHDPNTAIDREQRTTRDVSQNHNSERVNERHQQRDESRLSRENTPKLNIHNERRQVLARESRNIKANLPIARIVRSNERREASRDGTAERRHDFQVSRILETSSRTDRLVSDGERRQVRQQHLTRSLDRISVLQSSLDERTLTRFSERNIYDERAVRSFKRSVVEKDQSNVRRVSKERTIHTLRDTRENKLSQSLHSGSLTRLSRSDRESRIRGDSRSNERFDVSRRREREEHRLSWEHGEDRVAPETERRKDQELSRMSTSTEGIVSSERLPKNFEEVRSERFYVHREVRDDNRLSRNRIMQRRDRHVSELQRIYDTRGMSRNAESNTQLRRTKSLEDNRQEVRDRDDSRVSRERISESLVSRERNREEKRQVRSTTTDTRDIQNEVNRDRGVVRMGKRFEVHGRDEREKKFKDRVSMQYKSHIISSRPGERRSREHDVMIRSERLSERRDDRRIYDKEVRNNRGSYVETRHESKRMMDWEVLPHRQNVGLKRVHRTAPRENRDVRVETTLKSSDVARDVRTDTRREAIDTRYRNFDSKFREVEPVEEKSGNQNTVNWQIVFYTLHGAYLCGFLMQVLSEKSHNDKSRNLSWWVSSKNLLKID